MMLHATRERNAHDIVGLAATVVLAVCAVVITAILAQREIRRTTVTARPIQPQSDWLKYADGGNGVGPRGSPVAVVAFFDYECPACRLLEDRLRKARTHIAGGFTVVYRHFPLAIHTHAEHAAIASECAARQGRFESMHDAIFARGDSLGAVPWVRLAEQAGVQDTGAFNRCVGDSSAVLRLRRDLEAGAALKVQRTPTILVGGVRVTGVAPQSVLDSLIQASLALRRAP